MNLRTPIVAGWFLAVCIAVWWSKRDASEGEDCVTSTDDGQSAVNVGQNDVLQGEDLGRTARTTSVHARIVAEANLPAPPAGPPAMEERLARLRAGERPTIEEIMGPRRPLSGFEDPSIARNAGVWPATAEERLVRLRSGDLPPLLDYVEGPPGKPRLREGAPKSEVLAAWGTPAEVFPAYTVSRKPRDKFLMAKSFLAPYETDHIKHLERWNYESPEGIQGSWHFDGDLLTARPYSIESWRATLIEREVQNILVSRPPKENRSAP